MAEALKASPQIINDYLRLFINRRAYTMQSMRPHPESGRHYYFRPTKKDTGAPLELKRDDPAASRGSDHDWFVCDKSLLPVLQNGVAIDADYKSVMEDLLKLHDHLWQEGVEPAGDELTRGPSLLVPIRRMDRDR